MSSIPRPWRIQVCGLILCTTIVLCLWGTVTDSLLGQAKSSPRYRFWNYQKPVGSDPNSDDRYIWLERSDGVPVGSTTNGDGDVKNWAAEKSIRTRDFPTPEVFKILRRADQLEILTLFRPHTEKRCTFTGVDELPKLRALAIAGGGKDQDVADCKAVARCRQLKFLRFDDGIQIPESEFKEISNSKSLESIMLGHHNLASPAALAHLRKLSTLRGIFLEDSSPAALRELSQIPQLEELVFGYWTRVKDLAAFGELKKLPNLQSVTITEDDEEKYAALKAALPAGVLRINKDPR